MIKNLVYITGIILLSTPNVVSAQGPTRNESLELIRSRLEELSAMDEVELEARARKLISQGLGVVENGQELKRKEAELLELARLRKRRLEILSTVQTGLSEIFASIKEIRETALADKAIDEQTVKKRVMRAIELRSDDIENSRRIEKGINRQIASLDNRISGVRMEVDLLKGKIGYGEKRNLLPSAIPPLPSSIKAKVKTEEWTLPKEKSKLVNEVYNQIYGK